MFKAFLHFATVRCHFYVYLTLLEILRHSLTVKMAIVKLSRNLTDEKKLLKLEIHISLAIFSLKCCTICQLKATQPILKLKLTMSVFILKGIRPNHNQTKLWGDSRIVRMD